MHPTIPTKVARALVKRRDLLEEISELLDTVRAKREKGQIHKPGAYFLSSVRRIFQREEIPW
jgi:hypothetical protein